MSSLVEGKADDDAMTSTGTADDVDKVKSDDDDSSKGKMEVKEDAKVEEGGVSKAAAATNTNIEESTKHNDGMSQEDESEISVGISTYMVPGEGFTAVVKARYSDFLVHEVDMDGNIVKLTNRSLPTSSDTTKISDEDGSNKQDETQAETTNKAIEEKAEAAKEEANVEAVAASKEEETTTSPTDQSLNWPKLKSELQDMINDSECAEKVMEVLKDHEESVPSQDNKFVTLPSLEKPQRKAVHEWIRNSLFCARADTLDGKIRIWHVKFEKEMPNYKLFGNNRKNKRNNNKNDPRGNGNKKPRASWPEDRPNFLQFVLYKENMDTTTATKEISRKGSKARIGYAGMKDKRGITSQLCTLFKTEPDQILSSNRSGGGNTKKRGFGFVQVGNFSYVDKEIRLGSLKGNRFDIVLRNVTTATGGTATKKETLELAAKAMKEKGFINYFGTQRFGKYKNTHTTGIAVLQGNYKKAIDMILAPKPDDRQETTEARKEWQNRFANESLSESEKERKEIACAKKNLKFLNRFMTAESSILQSLSRKPLHYRRAFTAIPKTLRMMFLHAVQSLVWNRAASFRLSSMSKDKVVVGDLVLVNEKGDKSSDGVRLVTEEDVDKYTIEDIVLPLVGGKSKFPTNESGAAIQKIMEDIGITIDMFKTAQDKDLHIGGDYRKVVIRPNDFDYKVLEYYDPVQPLLQTDLMELNNEEIVITPPKKKDDGDDCGNEETLKYAMIVGFTLPSSAYATVALRELLKRPTSADYQKDLDLG